MTGHVSSIMGNDLIMYSTQFRGRSIDECCQRLNPFKTIINAIELQFYDVMALAVRGGWHQVTDEYIMTNIEMIVLKRYGT